MSNLIAQHSCVYMYTMYGTTVQQNSRVITWVRLQQVLTLGEVE